MTAQTIHQEQQSTTDADELSHRFCRDQWQASKEGPATARCGKTKTGWIVSDGQDMLCIVCFEMFKTGACTHCSNLARGGN